MANIRTVDFLPEIFQTPANKQFLQATLDQLVQEPNFKKTQGYVGRRVGPGVNPADRYVVEPTKSRRDYQLEPGVVSVKPESTTIEDVITYPGITDALALQGAFTDNADRLYTSEYYSWDPFISFDKFVNFSQYYWLPEGPLAVDVSSVDIPLIDTITVTKTDDGYTFSNAVGTNPTLTLLREGNYSFEVTQNQKQTVNYRVTNNSIASYVIDYQSNPTLTLVRGNTYVFTLILDGIYPFYIKTLASLGNVNLYNTGVTNNGAVTGTVTFTVPQDAPDTLYYSSGTQFNMRGQFNIINATPGTGSKFWIQTDPGITGAIPSTPNISGRDVLGVVNNGEDLGTVQFNVPANTAQNFYYSMTSLGTVDLVTTLLFNQINNQPVTTFNETYFGIDGITSLNGRTLIFSTQETDTDAGGWERTVLGDPFTSTPVPENQRFGVWQIQYVTVDGTEYIQLNNVLGVDQYEKFSILFGDVYASTQWYKGPSDTFLEIPLLTAIKDVLYYQDSTNANFFGEIKLVEDSSLNVDDIIGRKTYTSPNGVVFTNGLKVTFRGDIVPSSYLNNSYYVEGVGTAIKLLPIENYVTPEPYTQSFTVPYDSTSYDVGGYDQTLNAPEVPDYLTINIASPDRNAWSRSNRWFHIDVINASATYNDTVPVIDNLFRAKRPIIEFRSGTRLFNFGTEGKQPVDIIDFRETDAFSNIEGTTGYSVDGYPFINGSRVIFAADVDPQVRNKVYVVNFITPDTQAPLIDEPIINLVPASDADVLVDQTVVCLNGITLQGKSFWFDGVDWIEAQQKSATNQAPLFDVYDSAGVSFGDKIKYPSSTFVGSKLFSYAPGTGSNDSVLGFALKYLSLANVGDIVFDNNLYKDTFEYVEQNVGTTIEISSGFVREYASRTVFAKEIGWQTGITPSISRQQFQFSYDGSPIKLDVAVATESVVPAIQIYVNSAFQDPSNYTVSIGENTTTIRLTTTYVPGDIVEVVVISDQTSKTGFYQVPINLSNNPLNANSESFTLGTVRSHYQTIGENLINIQGPVIGANNTRDLGNLVPYGLQILQQSSPMTLAGYFMRNEQYNIFSALDYNSREYIKFKSVLLETVARNDYSTMSVAEILDSAVLEITQGRTDISPFYWSDMLPSGSVYTQTVNTVTPISTAVFSTVQTYDFTSANFKGLSVYLTRNPGTRNETTILLERDFEYVVATDGPRLTITITLNVGDIVTIREYADTAGNYVPNTPSKMGLYPKYRPEIFYDDNYVNPTLVIRGHDGSITVAFGDIRDDVLLEFEKRIYNNIKLDGNPIPLDADDIIPGFFRTTDYTQTEITNILSENFLSWVGWNKLDYKAQDYIAGNEFTYNYSAAGNRIDNQPLLGAWRGIARYFYDTLSPDTTPWQMLGFSEEPSWWQDRYGPAPYTSDNLVLWDDLEAGYVADPAVPYTIEKYARPGLTQVIPTGTEGQLLSPLNSQVGPYDPNAFRKSWAVGDGGPVEASWWTSSSYPYAVMRLLALTRPAQFFSLFADRDLYKYDNDVGQYLYNKRYRLDANGIEIYGNGTSKASYINWIVDYNRQTGVDSTDDLTSDLQNLDVRLCYRMASFTDKQYLKIFTERSSPDSVNSSLLLPDDSYNLLLYKNQAFSSIVYSALNIERTPDGYAVYGYNNATPYFKILASAANGTLTTISSGGASVRVPTQYTDTVVQVPYGYVFTNTTVVVDFILSYGAWLESQGLVFTDVENGYTLDWNQMAQEFLYFSQQGWANGTLISLNPVATTFRAVKEGAVVDTIVSTSPENMILNQNRQTLPTRDLIIERDFNNFSVTSPSQQSISFLKLKFTNYESMVVLDNVSIFNDLIYDPVTGARQGRIKIAASTAADWNGQLDAKGFILNQDNIKQWQSNRRYTKGEIVLYKNIYWSAQTIVQPKVEFDYNDWVKSDFTAIQTGLLPNIANKANQLANSYNTNDANLERDNDLLSYGLIGFRPREYMQALNLDDVSQVNIYQQFLGDKGTIRSAELFKSVDLSKESGEYNIYENWGVLSGTYGANANRSFFELQLNESLLPSDPSTVQVVLPQQTSQADQQILLNNIWRSSYALTSPDILPTTYSSLTDTALPTAGYVNIDDVDITVFDLNDPSTIAANIDSVGVGTTIWVAKVNSYDWDVYRCEHVSSRLTQITDNLNGTSIATFARAHGLSKGDLIIVRYFNSAVDGVYRVLSVPSIDTITIAFSFVNTNQTVLTGNAIAFYLQTARVAQASDIASLPYANSLVPGARAWVDNNGSGHWEVLEKQDQFTASSVLVAEPPVANSGFGTSISQTNDLFSALVGAPLDGTSGAVYTYRRNENNGYSRNITLTLNATGTSGFGNNLEFGSSNWAVVGASASNGNQGYACSLYQVPGSNNFKITQLFLAPDQDFGTTQFGKQVAISDDERWIYISAPVANKVYAYGRVDVETQSVSYVTDGTSQIFNYAEHIVIDSTYPDQLYVTLNNSNSIYGTDYSVNATSIVFNNPPAAGLKLTIARKQAAQLDQTTYYGVQQDSTSGIGSGATFTIDNVRGDYDVSLTAPGNNYAVSDTLTISYTQIEPTGSAANNLTITVTSVTDGGITGFTTSGTGITNETQFALDQYLYTATNMDSFIVAVNGTVQRPHIDYEFNEDSTTSTQDLTFLTVPPAGAVISVISDTYWQYCATIPTDDLALDPDALFGASLKTTTDGRQVMIGCPNDDSATMNNVGSVYVFDRSDIRYVITDTSETTYSMLGTPVGPVSVLLNGSFLNVRNLTENGITLVQFIDGQVDINLDTSEITLTNDVVLTVGDILDIETNEFQLVQKIISNNAFEEADFGAEVTVCPTNCSVYIGAPLDGSVLPQAGSVERRVNQSRVYGVISSNIANPTLTAGNTIRINNVEVEVPASPDNTVAGLADAIVVAGIPNVTASATPDLEFVGDGVTKIYNIGSTYSAQESYTPVVYVDDVLQTLGVNYTYNNDNEEILFISAPTRNSVIVVVSGRLTVSVKNSAAATALNKLTVLPGVVGSTFEQLGFESYAWTQTITSPRPTDFAYFGSSISVDTDAVNLVIGAPNGNVYEPMVFDGDETIFDDRSTGFYDPVFNGGVAYTYDYLPSIGTTIADPGQFVFGQQLFDEDIKSGDAFGTAVDYSKGRLLIGSPGSDLEDSALNYGRVSLFDNPTNAPAWGVIHVEQPVVDISLINSVFMYDKLTSTTQSYFDFFNPLQGKILGAARRNIDFIGAVDPAQYNVGTVHNNGNSWTEEHIGEIWWDTDTVRFIDPNQDDITYASRRWGQVFPGSRVDIYQWIESLVPPTTYTGPGTPLSLTSYSVNSSLNKDGIFETRYYFWVRGLTSINTSAGKTLSCSGIAQYIEAPRSSGIPYIAPINASTVAIYNAFGLISASDTILHIEYDREFTEANVHTEYELIASGRPDAFLSATLYKKLQDSFCGVNEAGALVPDPTLSPAERYGVQFRPRQSMFADRFVALENYLNRVNTVLQQYPITESRRFSLLNSSEPEPTTIAGGTSVSISIANPAVITWPNHSLNVNTPLIFSTAGSLPTGITAGTIYYISTITSSDTFTISATVGGTEIATSGTQSGVQTASLVVWNKRVANLEELYYQNINNVPFGYRYLVSSDSSQNGLWTIYEVVAGDLLGSRTLGLVRVQNYDTSRYWYYTNWYQVGYNSSISPKAEVANYSGLSTLSLTVAPIGSSVKVTANAQGKFEIYLRTDLGWDRVGLEDGTIQFSQELWNYSAGNFGFDVEVFDAQYFDQEPVIETRKIIQAINEELLIDDLAIERNSALMLMFDFVYTEFEAPDWLIKTSLIDVDHKIRQLLPYQTYLQDNQTFVLDYIQEVKPYHVQIREFNLTYNGFDSYNGMLTDFDVPAYWNTLLETPQYVSPVLLPYQQSGSLVENQNSDAPGNSEIWTLTPWDQWFNNYLLTVQDVNIIDGGAGYTEPPLVVFGQEWQPNTAYGIGEQIFYDTNLYTVAVAGTSGTAAPEFSSGTQIDGTASLSYAGTPATGIAVVNSAGQVVSIDIVDPGAGYRTTANITFTGGNGIGARATPVMGNDLVRSIKTVIKYDRCEYNSDITDWQAGVNYNNGDQVRYLNRVWQADSDDSTGVQSAIFDPTQWLEVDAGTLSAANRTQGFYTPTADQPGLELPLLIDGLDYPGVQVYGPDFSQNTGYDVGNYDINPYDNISYGPEGEPTYDPRILDAIYASDYLDPYLGTRATDVNVDGGAYVDTYESHAPEELVPGIEYDTLDLRVYTRPGSDWLYNGHGFAQKMVKEIAGLSSTTIDFSSVLPYPTSIEVSNETIDTALSLDENYTVDWVNQTITVTSGTSLGDTISVNVYGLGGGNQLYRNSYIGNQITGGNTITIPVDYDEIQELAIFINGVVASNYSYSAQGSSTVVTFGTTYGATDYISLTAIGPTILADGTEIDYSWSTPQTQVIIADGSTLTYDLDNSLIYTNQDNLIVTVNGLRARTSAGIEHYGDGSTQYLLPGRLGFSQALIAGPEVHVYIDDIQQVLGVDFTVTPYDAYTNNGIRSVEFAVEPDLGARILICVTTQSQCYVNGNQLVFVSGSGIDPNLGDVIAVTTWNDTRQQNLLTQVFVGPVTIGTTVQEGYDETTFDSGSITDAPGSFDYAASDLETINDFRLGRVVTDTSRLYVTLNGELLFFGQDFVISGEELVLNSGVISAADILMVTQYTNSVVPNAMAFRIFQDMRGVQATYRITDASTTQLAQGLDAADTVIYVTDASALSEPNLAINVWGVLTIDGERIMYRERDTINNTISGLLRGTAGTAIAAHEPNAFVYDMGRGNIMPEEFQNYVDSNSFLADGSTTTFIATDVSLYMGDSSTVLEDAIEVYVGGTKQTAGYSVTGDTPVSVVFDTAPDAGVEVTILVRRGVTWYNPGVGTPSDGVPLQDTNNQAARFLRGEN